MIKVFSIKDLIKYAITVTIPLVVLFTTINVVSGTVQNSEIIKTNGKAMLGIIDEEVDFLKISNKEDEEEQEYIKEWGKTILNNEFTIMNTNQNNTEVNNQDQLAEEELDNNEQEKEKTEESVNQAPENVQTEVVENSVKPKFNQEWNGVRINNSSSHEISDDTIDIDSVNVNKEKILIYHTHTCESYTPTELFNYEETGTFRTTDLNFSVARVGDELTNQFGSFGVNVLHDKTYHDYPAYNGSYSRSLKTAETILADNQDIDISIDLHRDAIGDSSYAPKVKIGDELVSQLMFVIGTDGGNPDHTTWNENLSFAIKVQKKANELYPGLFKPIIVRNSTYNQNISKAACIIEVGATGNTLEESIGAMKYLAKVIEEI